MNKLNRVAKASLSGEHGEGSGLQDQAGGVSPPERPGPASGGGGGAHAWNMMKNSGLNSSKRNRVHSGHCASELRGS